MRVLLTTFFVLCHVTRHPSAGSVFKAAVYEHVYIGLKSVTYVHTRKEALDIVMKNIDVYGQQIQTAKSKVFYTCFSLQVINIREIW